MRWYFLDTWYFVARFNRFDADHACAQRLSHSIRSRTQITHDAIFTEVLAYFSGFGARMRDHASKNVRLALRDFTVIPADHSLFLRALDFYERRLDKEYSLVDCMSMVVMEQRGIQHVLTNDHHFRQAGFTVLSDAP